jgi:multicomponent Na+:H+ antiporter subunit D
MPSMAALSALASLPVAVPLLGAATLAACRKIFSRRVFDTCSIAIAIVTLYFCIELLVCSRQQTVVYWFGNWFPRGSMVVGVGFVVDPAGAGLATLASLLFSLAFVFSWRYVDSGSNHYHSLMLVFLAAMCGFALTGDLFNLFVWFELMSTAAFALCGLNTSEPAPLQGSFNFAITNTVAAFLGLTGIAMLYAVTGALNMAQVGVALSSGNGSPRHDSLVLFAFTLLICCFFVKAAIVPFHLWLPDAHAVAPTPVCVIFSGLMVEFGLYAVVRLHAAIFQPLLAPKSLRAILLAFAVITILLGGIMSYAEHHLKRMLAFSTICHTGLMLAALAVLGADAVSAMLLYLVAHAFIKAALFFLCGVLLHRLRSMSEPRLFQKGRSLCWTALLWFLGGAALAGLPPFALFLGEGGASSASERAGVHGLWVLFLFGGAITAAGVFRVGMHIFPGWGTEPYTDRAADIDELPEDSGENDRVLPYHFLPPLFCLCASAALTVVPGWRDWVLTGAARLAWQPGYIHAVYSGATAGPPELPQLLKTLHATSAHELIVSGLRGVAATVLGLCFALSSVFRRRLPRELRVGAWLESHPSGLRALQSGHPGDYVLWLTVGVAVFGSVTMWVLQ